MCFVVFFNIFFFFFFFCLFLVFLKIYNIGLGNVRSEYTKNNKNLKNIILNHSNYYHWGKYLRETVEVFGNVLTRNNKKKRKLKFYHGIDKPLYFLKMVAFCTPTCTTAEILIAETFCDSSGFVLELCQYKNCINFYFDCFFSQFNNEKEYLFVAGYNVLQIKNIYSYFSTERSQYNDNDNDNDNIIEEYEKKYNDNDIRNDHILQNYFIENVNI